jgi:Rad52/22 family double-strand break repair protein
MTNTNEQIKPAPLADDVAPFRSIAAIIRDLSAPLHKRHLKTKPASRAGGEITFIEWHTAVKFLDYYAPGWSYHVKSVAQVGNLVAVVASISIPAAEGVITREATGCESMETTSYGDSVSNAEAMALKRAAAKFGLGLFLYSK